MKLPKSSQAYIDTLKLKQMNAIELYRLKRLIASNHNYDDSSYEIWNKSPYVELINKHYNNLIDSEIIKVKYKRLKNVSMVVIITFILCLGYVLLTR